MRHVLLVGLLALLAGPVSAAHGPRITIWMNNEVLADVTLRDNAAVIPRNLGDFVARVPFGSTGSVIIKGADDAPDRAIVKGVFRLHLAVNEEGKSASAKPSPPVVTVTFEDLLLIRSKSSKDVWYLSPEGIERIEKAIPKSSDK